MDTINLIGSIFQSDYIPFDYLDNNNKGFFDGYFYILGLFNINDVDYVLCITIVSYNDFNDSSFVLKYSNFNKYVINQRIYYYSNNIYINNNHPFYNKIFLI
jgi:hypothetical protein